jgi:uridine kinase
VIVLAGPSGAGKSQLAARVGLPVLRLDDFYKSADDPSLPVITDGANAGLVDWDHVDAWVRADALGAVRELCSVGRAEVPVYDISLSRRTGTQTLDLRGHRHFVAEGIFAQEIVPDCAEHGLLTAAYCITQPRAITFWRRLTRDLREHRKSPKVLVRRGWALFRDQPRVVAHAQALGCRVSSPDEALTELSELTRTEGARP